MTSELTALRSVIVAALADTPAVILDHVPELLSAPSVVIQPDDPWIDSADDQPFGYYTVSYVATVIVEVGTNALMTDDLDRLVGLAVTNLNGAGLPVTRVGGPYPFSSGTATYLAANLSIAETVKF